MSESSLWKDMGSHLRWRGHFSRVESHETSSGIPDVDYCINGVEGHVELKHSGNHKTPKVRGTQVRWFRDRIKAGGKPWVFSLLVVAGDEYYMLHSGDKIRELAESRDYRKWAKLATRVWCDGMDWEMLGMYLTGEINE